MPNPHRSFPRPRILLRLAVAVLLVLGLPSVSKAGSTTTTISNVGQARLPSGGAGLMAYTVEHVAGGPVSAGALLPGGRIREAEHPAAFEGMWGEAGQVAAWLAPQGRVQLSPSSSMIENVYYTASLHTGAQDLVDGDRLTAAIAHVPWDAPLPWDVPRGSATGTLDWDATTESRTVASTFAGAGGEMDVVLVRADVVARGGDVDARATSQRTPPLVIDLPREYPAQPVGSYLFGIASPYEEYVEGLSVQVVPSVGKAVITVNVRGYLPEAREYETAGGVSLKEGHIPYVGAIAVSTVDDPTQPRLAMDLASGGTAITGWVGRQEHTALPLGGRLVAGPGTAPTVESPEGSLPLRGSERQPEAGIEPGGGWLSQEIEAAAGVDHTLGSPVDLTIGHGTYSVRIDPDWRGQGALAVSPDRAETGTPYADVLSVPFVVVGGEPVRLDRDRLTDLRAFPLYPPLTFIATFATGSTPLIKVRRVSVSALRPGLVIQAAYDLGEGLVAFITATGVPDASAPGSVRVFVSVQSLAGQPVDAVPIQHVELPPGTVVHGGSQQVGELSAPLDSNGEISSLRVGDREIVASILRSGQDGRVWVLRGPAALSASPQADPARSLSGAPISIVYRGPDGLPPVPASKSTLRASLLTDGQPPEPDPRPIGTPCGQPPVEETALDAPAILDVREAWLDADPANVYATLRLGEVPAAAPMRTTLSWAVHWRHEHVTRFARAALNDSGQWTFDSGVYVSTAISTGGVSGESVAGENGLVRIVVPRSKLGVRDGELVRDIGAFSWITAADTATMVDQAPDGARPRTPHGGDFVVGECPVS